MPPASSNHFTSSVAKRGESTKRLPVGRPTKYECAPKDERALNPQRHTPSVISWGKIVAWGHVCSSPVFLTTLPPYDSTLLHASASWRASACDIRVSSRSHSAVLPSMSVKRNVVTEVCSCTTRAFQSACDSINST